MSDGDGKIAVVGIPSSISPYLFVLGGKGPVSELPAEANDDQLAFQVREFVLRDAICELGSLDIDLMLPGLEAADELVDKILGKPVMFAWACGTELKRSFRYFHGIVSEFAETGGDHRATCYRAMVVPRAWRLSLQTRCRVYGSESEKLTIPQIIAQVFADHGLVEGEDLDLSELSGQYDQRQFCVQYRESDLNFVSRLMEGVGIAYYVDHTEERDVLVLADQESDGYSSCHPFDSILVAASELLPLQDDESAEECLYAFHLNNSLRPGRVSLRDYNFENSTAPPSGEASGIRDSEPEIYDYPGGFADDNQGATVAKMRMQESDWQAQVANGNSDFRSLAAGKTFSIRGHSQSSYNCEYLCTEVTHTGTNENLIGLDGSPVGAGGVTFSNSFECIPSSVPYRPTRVTPRPVVLSAQTAKVVGEGTEEIYTDKFLRVKVQFHWDREGTNDEKSSCWVRVVQPWADKAFGIVTLPRIGTEVFVEFLEGDPDRPIVNGVVYNDRHMPPFPQAENKTQTGIRTRSSPEGKENHYNELVFEDRKDHELIRIHAEKDLSTTVENDENRSVGNDRRTTISNDEFETVKGNRHLVVEQEELERITGNRHTIVTADHLVRVAGTSSLQTNSLQRYASDVVAVESGMEVHIKAGTKIVLEAGSEITLQAGANFIKLGQDGITIMGAPMTKINSGGEPGSGCGIETKDPKEAQPTDSGA